MYYDDEEGNRVYTLKVCWQRGEAAALCCVVGRGVEQQQQEKRRSLVIVSLALAWPSLC